MARLSLARSQVSVGVVTPQPVIAAGLVGLLQGVHGCFEVTFEDPPDVVFYDALCLREGDGADLDALVQRRTAVVIVLTNELRPELGAAALERGATAAISMAATRADFLVVLQAALCGDLARCGPARAAQVGTQRGCEVGLTWREAEVIAGIVAGLSNREIATKSGLSINTVKSVVRSAYRKMEVETRSQAVKWGVQHGFAFDTRARSCAEPLRRLPRGSARLASSRAGRTASGTPVTG